MSRRGGSKAVLPLRVDGWKLLPGGLFGDDVQPLVEDGLDRSVVDVSKHKGPLAGLLESWGGISLGQAQDALDFPKIVHDGVGKKLLDDFATGGTDSSRLFTTPDGVLHEVRLGIGRHVRVDRVPASRSFQPRMCGDQARLLVVDPEKRVSRLDPDVFFDVEVGNRVGVFFKGDVPGVLHLVLFPDNDLDGAVRKRTEKVLFNAPKEIERPLAGGAVDPVAGLARHPGFQLFVGDVDVGEGPQRKEGIFDVLDPRLDAPFLVSQQLHVVRAGRPHR